jgi:hypothetical protein
LLPPLKKFEECSWGADIYVFTDHKNLTFNTLMMQHVLLWHNKVKEFLSTLHYIEGPCNILADNLSRLHSLVTPAQITEGKSLVDPAVVFDDEDELYLLDQEYAGFNDSRKWETLGCYLNLPEIPHPEHNLLNYAHICEKLVVQAKYPDKHVNL